MAQTGLGSPGTDFPSSKIFNSLVNLNSSKLNFHALIESYGLWPALRVRKGSPVKYMSMRFYRHVDLNVLQLSPLLIGKRDCQISCYSSYQILEKWSDWFLPFIRSFKCRSTPHFVVKVFKYKLYHIKHTHTRARVQARWTHKQVNKKESDYGAACPR